jgi:hypothetical protein
MSTNFPHLDHFLNAYMHQDWMLFGDNLPAVLQTYAKDTSVSDVRALRTEIAAFVHDGIDYHRRFPNSVLPSGWNMQPDEWLNHVAHLAADLTAS